MTLHIEMLSTHCWPDLVLHTLAHVRPLSPQPAATFDPGYVAFARACLGAPDERALGRDALELERVLRDYAHWVAVQPLCRLFETTARAAACAVSDLHDLSPDQVDEPSHLTAVLRAEAASELLRCAALLELPHYLRLPRIERSDRRIEPALADLLPVAPMLRGLPVRTLRALGWFGRLWPDAIWVGVPDVTGVPLEHIAWQAAHEATLAEVMSVAHRSMPAPSERRLEAVALVLLAERSAQRELGEAHARWYARFGASADQAAPSALSDTERALLERCLAKPSAHH